MCNIMNNKWMKTLNVQNLFGRKKKNRGVMWASMIGLGVGAAAYGVTKSQNSKNSLQNIMNTFTKQQNKNIQMPNYAAMTEFSKEIIPEENPLDNE